MMLVHQCIRLFHVRLSSLVLNSMYSLCKTRQSSSIQAIYFIAKQKTLHLPDQESLIQRPDLTSYFSSKISKKTTYHLLIRNLHRPPGLHSISQGPHHALLTNGLHRGLRGLKAIVNNQYSKKPTVCTVPKKHLRNVSLFF